MRQRGVVKELSRKLNRHQSTISRWFNGTRSISSEDAKTLERVTGIDRRAWLWPEEFHNPYLSKDAAPCAGCEEQHG